MSSLGVAGLPLEPAAGQLHENRACIADAVAVGIGLVVPVCAVRDKPAVVIAVQDPIAVKIPRWVQILPHATLRGKLAPDTGGVGGNQPEFDVPALLHIAFPDGLGDGASELDQVRGGRLWHDQPGTRKPSAGGSFDLKSRESNQEPGEVTDRILFVADQQAKVPAHGSIRRDHGCRGEYSRSGGCW